MCECKIEYAIDEYGGVNLHKPDRIIYCPLHGSALQLQARVTQLEEALKVAKQKIIDYCNEIGTDELNYNQAIILQINEALSPTAGDGSGE